MPTYVVGDIHGCLEELQALLALVDFQPNRDTLISVGDLVNRGPQSLETLLFLAELPSFQCVLGNHDLYLLALWQGASYPSHQLDSILNHAECHSLLCWLLNHPLILQYEHWTIVHAGVPPIWSVHQATNHAEQAQEAYQNNPKAFFSTMVGNYPTQWDHSLNQTDQHRYTINALTRMRLVSKTGELSLEQQGSDHPSKFSPWFTHVNHRCHEESPLIFGHWAALNGKTNHPHIIGLDTGCVWGGRLSAIRLEDQQRFHVHSQQPLRHSP